MLARVDSKTRKKAERLLRHAEGALLPQAVLGAEGAHLAPQQALAGLAKRLAERPEVPLGPRVERLLEAAGSSERAREYIERFGCAGVVRFPLRGGVTIYLLPVETFPNHINNVYLILEPGHAMMF